MGAEPRGPQVRQQGGRLLGAAALAAALALGGCAWVPGFVHRHEGGEIAKKQVPPPGANKPYPNLASVPARPKAPDKAQLQALADSLIAARETGHTLLVATPDPSLPSTAPSLFGVGTAPPPAPAPSGGAAASLAAVNGPAPPPKTTTTTKAPTVAPPARPAVIPTGPPAPPQLANLARQPSRGATSLPGAAPVPPVSRAVQARPLAGPIPPPNPATTVEVAFPSGSAILPAKAASALKALAARRGGHPIAVIGHGGAEGAAPAAQGAAVGLGLKRAQAMAQALTADGVPANAIRIGSEAEGRGGVAHILQ